MDNPDTRDVATIHYEERPGKPTLAATGAFGGPTPDHLNVVAHLYVEHSMIPSISEVIVDEDGVDVLRRVTNQFSEPSFPLALLPSDRRLPDQLNPDLRGEFRGAGRARYEAVSFVGGEIACAGSPPRAFAAEVDLAGGEQPDAAVPVLGVVPREELAAFASSMCRGSRGGTVLPSEYGLAARRASSCAVQWLGLSE